MIALIILWVLIFISFLLGIYYLWFILWWVRSDNICEDEIVELKEEIKRWKNQCKAITNDRDKIKRLLDEMISKSKNTIAEKYEDDIKYRFNEWLSDVQIAKKIWCWKSTIQRAVKKFWLR